MAQHFTDIATYRLNPPNGPNKLKLDWAAPLISDPPNANSTLLQYTFLFQPHFHFLIDLDLECTSCCWQALLEEAVEVGWDLENIWTELHQLSQAEVSYTALL